MLGSLSRRVNADAEGPMKVRARAFVLAVVLLPGAAACSRAPGPGTAPRDRTNGPLIPASATTVTVWQVPKNPLADASLDSSPLS